MNGFSLIEMLIVLAIIALIFSMSSFIIQSLDLTSDIIKQNKQYESISQIYNYLNHLENAIVVKNDFSNNQFLYQLPLLDSNNKITDPIKGGNWYSIKCINGQLIKTNLSNNNKMIITPKDIIVKSTTFDFDFKYKQLRVTLDITVINSNHKDTRVSMIVDMLNILNEVE